MAASPQRRAEVAALRRRLAALHDERRALAARIAEVAAALERLEGAALERLEGAALERLGGPAGPWEPGAAADDAAYAGDGGVPVPRGWAALGDDGRAAVLADHEVLARSWARTWAAGEPVEGAAAQALARRHREWLSRALGVPAEARDLLAARSVLAADPAAAREYDRHGDGVAAYVRDALAELAARV